MDDLQRAWDLLVFFATLSLTTLGAGPISVLPDMHHFLVEQHAWLSETQFRAAVALSQAAPGPNALFCAMFGLQIAGTWGMLAGWLGITTPSGVLAWCFEFYSARFTQNPIAKRYLSSIGPITVVMLLASSLLLARSADSNLLLALLTVATVVLSIRTKITPLAWISVGAAAGALQALLQ